MQQRKIAYLYKGKQEIISSLVKYVTAQDIYLIGYHKKWFKQKSYLISDSLLKVLNYLPVKLKLEINALHIISY